MKKILSLILAVMMLLGCMSLTAFATDNNTTEITATVANSLSYDMVIPSAVTMTKAEVKEIGKPSVKNVKFATDDTVISYTATGTQLTLVGGTATMVTSYYTDSTGTTAMPSTAIEVYKSGAVVSPLTTLYVGVAQSAWDAAENGTYKATVTFNFTSEEKAAAVTVASILPADFPESKDASTWTNASAKLYVSSDDLCTSSMSGPGLKSVPTDTVLTPAGNDTYTCTVYDLTWTFTVSGGKFNKVNITGSSQYTELNGDYTAPAAPVTIASILPDDFPTTSSSGWTNGKGILMYLSAGDLFVDGPQSTSIASNIVLTPTEGGNYTYTSEYDDTWTFTMNGSKCNKITISGDHEFRNGDFIAS